MPANNIWEILGKLLLSFIQKKPEVSVTIPFDGPAIDQLQEKAPELQKFELRRFKEGPDGILGELFYQNHHFCFTAEHAYDSKPKLPAGTYICKKGDHTLHSGPVVAFEVQNVPGHTGILLHIGNDPQVDSDGCILLGDGQTGNQVTNSGIAFKDFMSMLSDVEQIELTVS